MTKEEMSKINTAAEIKANIMWPDTKDTLMTDKKGTEWCRIDKDEPWRVKYILEHPYDTLETIREIMLDTHIDDELEEMYDDFGLVVLIYSKKMNKAIKNKG